MRQFDIIIIGNGILGLSTAHALMLEDPNLSIALIGPSHRSGGATMAAGAMLGCFGEVTKYTFQSEPAVQKFELSIRAKTMWDDWLESINMRNKVAERMVIDKGTFIILNSKSGVLDDENYQSIRDALIDKKECFEDVNPRNIRLINPIPDIRPLKATYLPNEGSINSLMLIKNLQNALISYRRVKFIDDEAIRTQHCIGKDHKVYTKLNHYSCKNILVAAGAFSQEIISHIPELSFKIPPIFSGVGCSLTLSQPAHQFTRVVRTPNRAGACGIHVMGRDENSLFIGASNYISSIPKTKNKLRYIYYMTQYVMEQIDQRFHNAEVLQWFSGCRPVSLDSFPLFGETSIRGLWILSGTYRDGIHLSPVLATAMAKRILNKPEEIVSKAFVPERIPIQTMDQAQSVDEFVAQTMASSYEHSINLPRNGWDEQLPLLIKATVRRLYQELDCDFALPIEILLMLQREPQLVPWFRQYLQSVGSKRLDMAIFSH